MAEEVKKDNKKNSIFNRSVGNINSIIDDMSMSLYGSRTNTDTESLDEKFNEIMSRDLNYVTGNGTNDYTTFIGKIYDSDREERSTLRTINSKLDLGSTTGLNPTQFISDKYKNRMLKQHDANQIANQLIELTEAKNTMKDAILSTDINSGRINRKIIFETSTINDVETDYMPIIESMEKTFDTPKLIKDFIADGALSYGEYYVYTIPYSEIFQNFASKYKMKNGFHNFFEAVEEGFHDIKIESLFESGDESVQIFTEDVTSILGYEEGSREYNEVTHDMELLSDRVTISTSHIPIPILENGLEYMSELIEAGFITESGNFNEEADYFGGMYKKYSDNVGSGFIKKYDSDDGTYEDSKNKEEKFDDIKDCYVKMIPPTSLIPVEVMNQVLFYIYIETEDAVPIDTILSYQSQLKERNSTDRIDALIEDIANKVISKFNKKFISENKEFRKLIVAALEYYDMGNTKIHFQVIPKEFITSFKINTDTEGHGHSMLEPSLFYAKLYLMLLMFKIVTIVTKSNDQEINYIKTSGIDKNVFNKAQEIARRKQARRITVNDMFSYTGMLNKIASGSAIYMPLAKNGDRPIETEILQGQDVQLNTDLMEMLRNNYILGSGVPSAIMNYLNEADFAKSIETANTKMNGRVINYQIDLNGPLTEWYQKLLRFSTNMPEEVIKTVKVVLPEPKGTSNITQQELITNYTSLQEFLSKIYFGESVEDETHLQLFLKELAKMHLPMVNFKEIDEIFRRTQMEAQEKILERDDGEEGSDEI